MKAERAGMVFPRSRLLPFASDYIGKRSGFTLIEVSLAIVIGILVLAGVISVYNQSRIAAGNAKALDKSEALASLVEEMNASAGSQPPVAALTAAWQSRRTDAGLSPWSGGPVLASIWAAGFVSYPAASIGTASVAEPGMMAYANSYSNAAGINVWDQNQVCLKPVRSFFVCFVDFNNVYPSFVVGGK